MGKKTIIVIAGLVLVGGAVAAYAERGWHGHERGMHGMRGERGHMREGGRWGDQGLMGERGPMGELGIGGRGFFRDRNLSSEEVDARLRERFARFDSNGDGVLDRSEVEAEFTRRQDERRRRLAERFARHDGEQATDRMLRRFDSDGDGKITREEFTARAERRFAELDLNSDGRIDDADLPPMMRGRDVLRGGVDGGGRGWRRSGMGGMGELRAADVDNDGIVTKEEFLTHVNKRFDAFDANKDGVIDQADRDAKRKEMTDYRVQRFLHMFGAAPNGQVTREKFMEVAKERFAEMARERDGERRGPRGRGRGHGDL